MILVEGYVRYDSRIALGQAKQRKKAILHMASCNRL